MLLAGIGAMVWWYASQTQERPTGPVPETDPLRRLAGHAVAAGDGQVFLGRGGDDPRANPARRRHGSLRRRGRRLLRHSSLEVASLQRDSDVAPATRRASGLRRRGWPLGCSSGRWSAASEPKGQRLGVNILFVALLVVVVGSMAGQWLSIQNQLSPTRIVLLRPPGLRVHRPGPSLADRPLRRPAALVVPGRASGRSGLEEVRRTAAPAADFLDGLDRHRPVLRCRPHLGPAHPPVDCGILALVGGSPVGGRVLRGLCDHGHRLLLHAARTWSRLGWRRQASLLSATIFLSGGIIGTLPPPVLLRALPPWRWPGGRCSAPWKSCR